MNLTPAKDVREKQKAECVGRLRNPSRAVARSPNLRATGKKIRQVFENIFCDIQDFKGAMAVLDTVGQQDAKGFSAELIAKARQALAKEFGTVYPEANVGKVHRHSF